MARPAEPPARPPLPQPVTCGHANRPRHGTLCTACYFRERRKAQAERKASERQRIERRLAELARMSE